MSGAMQYAGRMPGSTPRSTETRGDESRPRIDIYRPNITSMEARLIATMSKLAYRGEDIIEAIRSARAS